MPKTILEVIDLKKHFTHRKGLFSSFKEKQQSIPAVDGVSFYLKENETVGLVGESGCGKTTIGRTILRLDARDLGQDHLRRQGHHRACRPEELRQLRGQMQMIFQDLDAALNPQDAHPRHPARGDHRPSPDRATPRWTSGSTSCSSR